MTPTPTKGPLAWHFVRDDGRMRCGTPTVVGETYRVEPPLVLCDHGLHWSRRAIDALRWAPGARVCLVRAGGEIVEGSDKGCSTERTVLGMADATALLHEVACDEAERALLREREAGREPDKRSWRAIEVKRRWLRGEASDKELAAARDAALDAELAAAWAAALAAARDAALDAALDAARDAAWDAAWPAVWDAANARLTRRLLDLLGVDGDLRAEAMAQCEEATA